MTFQTDIIADNIDSTAIAAALNSAYTYVNAVGYSSAVFRLNVPTGATCAFEATNDGTNWFSIRFALISNSALFTEVTISGDFNGSILGFAQWRVRVSVAGSAPGSIIGRVVREAGGGLSTSALGDNNPISVQFTTAAQTAFGDLLVAQLTPVIQLIFSYNLNARLVSLTTANGGTVSYTQPFAVCASGTNTAGSAIMSSIRRVTYRAGIGILARFTARFTAGFASNTTITGIGDAENGLFFGYNGTAFGILRRFTLSGVTTNDWTPQTSWNIDKMDGTGPTLMTLDKTKGNIFQIRMQWLGFGQISFFVEDPATGNRQLVHAIRYANSNTQTSVTVPSFGFRVETTNTGSTSNSVVFVPSVSVLYEGVVDFGGLLNSTFNQTSTGVTTGAINNVIAIRNDVDIFGGTGNNRTQLIIKTFAVTNTGNKTVVFRLLISHVGSPATFTPALSFTQVSSTTSIASQATNASVITGSYVQISSISIPPNIANLVNLDQFGLSLNPGDIVILSFSTFSTTTGTAEGSISWGELL